MRIYIVTAGVMERDTYLGYSNKPDDLQILLIPMVDPPGYAPCGMYTSIMGVYRTREQAGHRVRELAREHFPDLQIFEETLDANCWDCVGGYIDG